MNTPHYDPKEIHPRDIMLAAATLLAANGPVESHTLESIEKAIEVADLIRAGVELRREGEANFDYDDDEP